MFSLAIVSLLILSLVALFLNGLRFENSIDFLFKEYSSQKNPPSRSAVTRDLFLGVLLIIGIQFMSFFIGAVMFFKGIFNSYKSKSFERLSSAPSLFMGVSFFLAILHIFSILTNFSERSFYISQTQGILYFVLQIFIIVVFFSISIQVNRIRRLFMLSARIEEFKKTPQYKMMQQQFNNMQMQQPTQTQGNSSPYGPPAATAVAAASENNNKADDSPVNKQELKLNKMKLNSLRKVASKLFISGFEEMNKQELIKAILRVTQNEK